MNGSHVAGGGIGGLVGVVLVALGSRVGLDLTNYDSATIGLAAVSIGLGVGHAIGENGLFGIARVILHGRPKPSAGLVPNWSKPGTMIDPASTSTDPVG